MQSPLLSQYEMIKDSRHVLFEYCANIPSVHLIEDIKSFGRGSIRNLLVHTTNTYKFWLKENALNEKVTYEDAQHYRTIEDIVPLYKEVDLLVENFILMFANRCDAPLTIKNIGGFEKIITPLKLFTHVITHEFHHKGQILSMSRHLGYIPPDTDIIR